MSEKNITIVMLALCQMRSAWEGDMPGSSFAGSHPGAELLYKKAHEILATRSLKGG